MGKVRLLSHVCLLILPVPPGQMGAVGPATSQVAQVGIWGLFCAPDVEAGTCSRRSLGPHARASVRTLPAKL